MSIKWLSGPESTLGITYAAAEPGIVKNTFCLGTELLEQFDSVTAVAILSRLADMGWKVTSTAHNGTYTTSIVTYTHVASGAGAAFDMFPGYYMLANTKLANMSGSSPDPWGSAVTVMVTNDPSVIWTLARVQPSKFSTQYANLSPLLPVPTKCLDGSNPITGAPAPTPVLSPKTPLVPTPTPLPSINTPIPSPKTPLIATPTPGQFLSPAQSQTLPQQMLPACQPKEQWNAVTSMCVPRCDARKGFVWDQDQQKCVLAATSGVHFSPTSLVLMQTIFAREALRLMGPVEGVTPVNVSKALSDAQIVVDAYTKCSTAVPWATDADALKELPCMAWFWARSAESQRNKNLNDSDCRYLVSFLVDGSKIPSGSTNDCALAPVDPLYNTVAGVLAVEANPTPYPCASGTSYDTELRMCVAPAGGGGEGPSTEPLPVFDRIEATKVIQAAILVAQTKCSGVLAGTAEVTVTYTNKGAPRSIDITPNAFDAKTRKCVLSNINSYLLSSDNTLPAFAGTPVPLKAPITLTGPAAPVWPDAQKDIMRLAIVREYLRQVGPEPTLSAAALAKEALTDGKAFVDAVVQCVNDQPWATDDSAVVEMRCLAGKWSQLTQAQKNALLANSDKPGCATLTNIRGALVNLTCSPATLTDPAYNTVASLQAIVGKESPYSDAHWTDANGGFHTCVVEAGKSHFDTATNQCVLDTTALPGLGTCEISFRWDAATSKCIPDGCAVGQTHWDDKAGKCVPYAKKAVASTGGGGDGTAILVGLAVVGGIAVALMSGAGKAAALSRNPMLSSNPRVSRTKVSQAYYMLVELVAAGYEFPHAHERAVMKFKLNDDESTALTEEYDAEQAKTNPVRRLPPGNPYQRRY